MKLKIIASVGDTNIVVRVKVSIDNFKMQLGKTLYGVEQMGVDIVTSDVYKECEMSLNSAHLSDKYVNIYSAENIEVLVKLNK